MRYSYKLFTVFGIEVRVHISFLLIVAYFAYIWGVIQPPGGWGGALYGALLVIMLFAFVVIHELTHSRVAQHYGIEVKGITLLPIGGMAQMAEIPAEAKKELAISVAGPLSNLVIAALMGVGSLFIDFGGITNAEELGALLFSRTWQGTYMYLLLINIVLALFNLLPAFPMDGGRVFRALLSLWMDRSRATRVAMVVGQVMAILLGLWGLFGGGLLLLVIAVFIYFGASAEGRGEEVKSTLSDLRVSQAVNTKVEFARPTQTIGELAARLFHIYQEDFPVIDEEGGLVGILTRDALIRALGQHGTGYLVAEAMRREFPVASPAEGVYEAFNKMRTENIKAMPVVEAGRFVGLVSMEDISEVYTLLSAAGPELVRKVSNQR
jgi:Zn-dependent protease/predicted transcriptional regulator